MIAANWIAFAISGSNISYFVISIASYAFLLLVFDKVVHLIHRSASEKWKSEYVQAQQVVLKLSLEEAAKRSEYLMADPQRFVVEKARPDVVPRRTELAPELVALFSKYESIRTASGEFQVAWNLIGDSDFRPGFLRIGADYDHTEVAVKPGVETIYEIDGSGSSVEAETVSFPSIFHLIIVRSRRGTRNDSHAVLRSPSWLQRHFRRPGSNV